MMVQSKGEGITDIKVLVVDDNEHALTLVSQMLRGLGIRGVHNTTSVLEALHHLRTEAVDLMITDLKMEPVDGITLVRLIRTAADSPKPDLPIIMVTAFDEPEFVAEAREAGVNAYLTKPVSARTLYQHIVRVLGPCKGAKSSSGGRKAKRGPPKKS